MPKCSKVIKEIETGTETVWQVKVSREMEKVGGCMVHWMDAMWVLLWVQLHYEFSATVVARKTHHIGC